MIEKNGSLSNWASRYLQNRPLPSINEITRSLWMGRDTWISGVIILLAGVLTPFIPRVALNLPPPFKCLNAQGTHQPLYQFVASWLLHPLPAANSSDLNKRPLAPKTADETPDKFTLEQPNPNPQKREAGSSSFPINFQWTFFVSFREG